MREVIFFGLLACSWLVVAAIRISPDAAEQAPQYYTLTLGSGLDGSAVIQSEPQFQNIGMLLIEDINKVQCQIDDTTALAEGIQPILELHNPRSREILTLAIWDEGHTSQLVSAIVQTLGDYKVRAIDIDASWISQNSLGESVKVNNGIVQNFILFVRRLRGSLNQLYQDAPKPTIVITVGAVPWPNQVDFQKTVNDVAEDLDIYFRVILLRPNPHNLRYDANRQPASYLTNLPASQKDVDESTSSSSSGNGSGGLDSGGDYSPSRKESKALINRQTKLAQSDQFSAHEKEINLAQQWIEGGLSVERLVIRYNFPMETTSPTRSRGLGDRENSLSNLNSFKTRSTYFKPSGKQYTRH
ncbi:hypothetical protein H4R33_002471 [Dimargaris cristalligena]|nr:hypothetical protein H4R33_002471 [Dimargaris cristalligena]